MIRLTNSFFSSYFYDKYIIRNIKFYNENGVIVENNCGWLEKGGIRLDTIYLNVDEIQLKRKEDFNIKGAFIISLGEKSFDDKIEANLYINAKLFNVVFKEYKKDYNSIDKCFVGQTSDNQEFEIKQIAKWLLDDLYDYRRKIEEIGKELNNFYGGIEKEVFDKYIKDLQKYGKQYYEEEKRVESYSVEDYLKEMESK